MMYTKMMSKKCDCRSEENSAKSPLSIVGKRNNPSDLFPPSNSKSRPGTKNTAAVMELLASLQTFGCEGDSRTEGLDSPKFNHPICSAEQHASKSTRLKPSSCSPSKVIHIDIAPGANDEIEEEICDPVPRHIRETKKKAPKFPTTCLKIAESDSVRNFQILQAERLALTDAPRRGKSSSLESIHQNTSKHTKPQQTVDESVLEDRSDSKFHEGHCAKAGPRSTHEFNVECFTQTDARDLKDQRRSKIKKNLETLFFSCARYCI